MKLILSSPGSRVAQARHLPGNRSDPGQHLALRQRPVAHQPRPAIGKLFRQKAGQKRRQLRPDPLFTEVARQDRIPPVNASGTKPDRPGRRVMGSSPLWHILFWDENRRRLTTAMICRTARHHQVSSDFRTRRPAIVGFAGAGRGRLRGSFWNWKDIRPKRKRS